MNTLHHFLTDLLICKAEISLMVTFLGIPFTFILFPLLLIDVIFLSKQFSKTLCSSIQSIPINRSYDPKGNIFTFTWVRKSFKNLLKFLTVLVTFLFVHVANYTRQDLSKFSGAKLHKSTTLGEI